MSKEKEKKQKDKSKKKSYKKPKLQEYGSIKELTMSGGSNMMDFGGMRP